MSKLVFKTKKEATEFLRQQSYLYEPNKGFSPKGTYYLCHGEYEAPDFKPVRYKDGWGIKKVHYFYSGTFNTPQDKGMIPNPEIGYTPNNLKAVRMAYRLTQLDVANIVGTSQRMVMRWETDIKQTSAHSDMPHTKWVKLLDVLQQKNEQ